jgi:hypothetical protein
MLIVGKARDLGYELSYDLTLRNWEYLRKRIAFLRLDPSEHPIPCDQLLKLVCCGVRSSRAGRRGCARPSPAAAPERRARRSPLSPQGGTQDRRRGTRGRRSLALSARGSGRRGRHATRERRADGGGRAHRMTRAVEAVHRAVIYGDHGEYVCSTELSIASHETVVVVVADDVAHEARLGARMERQELRTSPSPAPRTIAASLAT